jgi:TolB-like protein
MATVSALILFDALRQDLETTGRQSTTSFSRPQLRDAMGAHPAWEGKAFEETSFNTVPEDLGDQLEQFVHEDFIGGRKYRFRFRGPTRKFRKEKASKELYLEIESEAFDESPTRVRRPVTIALASLLAIGVLIAIAALILRRPHEVPKPSAEARAVTLAVLPFRLLGNDAQLRFLGTGIADAVITRLSNSDVITVRPTTAVLQYENHSGDLRPVGRALAADYVVSGILQPAGDRLRAGVQLIRTEDGAAIWGQQFDVPSGDLLSLEDSIADRVVSSLAPRLNADQRARVARRFTSNPVAYEHYLRGRAAMLLETGEGTKEAISEFEKAIASDPSYALARAGLANSAALMRIRFAPKNGTAMWSARAKQEAEEALRLAPDLAEAHEAMAAVYRYDEFDWVKVMDESGRAIALNPDLELAHDYRGAAAMHLGLLPLAEREARIAMEINPQRPIEALRIKGVVALFNGEYSGALQTLQEVAQRTDISDYYLGLALFYTGRSAEGESLLHRLGGGETRNARAAAALASILAARGDKKEASRIVQRVVRESAIDHHVAYSLGAAYAQIGDTSQSLRWLNEAVRIGFPCYPWFARDPLLQPLRGNTQYEVLLTRLREQNDAWSKTYSK